MFIASVFIAATYRREWQLKLKFRHLLGNPSDKGIAVRARKSFISIRPGVAGSGLIDGWNQLLRLVSSDFLEQTWTLTEPIAVGKVRFYANERKTSILSPSN